MDLTKPNLALACVLFLHAAWFHSAFFQGERFVHFLCFTCHFIFFRPVLTCSTVMVSWPLKIRVGRSASVNVVICNTLSFTISFPLIWLTNFPSRRPSFAKTWGNVHGKCHRNEGCTLSNVIQVMAIYSMFIMLQLAPLLKDWTTIKMALNVEIMATRFLDAIVGHMKGRVCVEMSYY